MAEKKKLSVAEILAAARKADAKGGAAPSGGEAEPAPAASEEAAAAPLEPAAEPAGEAPAEAMPPAAPSAKPAAAKGERPSVADILAMARAKKEGAAAPAAAKPAPAKAAPKPAAAKPAAAARPAPAETAAVEKTAGPRDTASILAAARKSARPGPMTKAEAARIKAETAAPDVKTKPKAVAPPMPAKPAYAQAKTTKPAAEKEDRRFFLGVLVGSFLGLGFTSLAATAGLWTLAMARFMFPNVLAAPPSQFKVGFPSDYPLGAVETKYIAQFGTWVVHYEYNGQEQIYALQSVCTHLGCTPNWLDAEQKFKCPCHGSGFYKDGINFEGPAPRPLERFAIRIADDGQLEVDKSQKFQEEMGEWENPASFVLV